jgi:Zn-dependent protease
MLFSGFTPIELIARLVAIFISLTFHEFSHAWTADRFGDDTPRMNGRLTLNPLAHIDPIGALLLLIAGFGWAKPVPVNPYALQRRSSAAPMLVSLAGPASNFLLALLVAIPFRLGVLTYNTIGGNNSIVFILQVILQFAQINLVLMLFNLIPIPPLDGDKILEYFLPARWAQFMDPIRQFGPMILMVVVFALPLVGFNVIEKLIGPPMQALMKLLFGIG